MALPARDVDKRVELRSSREGPIEFRHASEAARYLRNSSHRPGVIAALRKLLTEHHHVQVWRLPDDAVIDEVARRIVNGSLQLLELLEPKAGTQHKTTAAKQAEEAVRANQTSRVSAHARVEAERRSRGTSPDDDNRVGMALLYRDLDKRVGIRSARDGRIRQHRYAAAVEFLHTHRDDPGVTAALRKALAVHTPIDVGRLSDEGVFAEVERRLLNGSLQLMEMFAPRIEGRATPPQEKEEEETTAVSAAAIIAAATQVAAALPLLPLLEEVQIEGAEVMPEIMQTLEQIDLTMAKIDLANVSLEPTPSGVPAIGSAMQRASSFITASLGEM